jgi:hypothetical protein
MNRMAGAAAGYAIMTLSIWADFDECVGPIALRVLFRPALLAS